MILRMALLLAPLVSMAACAPSSPFPSPAALDEPHCVEGRWSPLDEVRETLGADFVALVPAAGRALRTTPRWIESGERCVDFDGSEVCVTDERLRDDSNDFSLLFTWTGGVRRVLSLETAREELAPIESVDEALVLAVLAGFEEPTCDDASLSGGRRIDGEWELVAVGDVECADIDPGTKRDHYMRHWLRVTDDGEIRSLAKELGRASEYECYDHCSCFDLLDPRVDVREHE